MSAAKKSKDSTLTVDEEHVGGILAALRMWLPGESWSAVRKIVRARRVLLNGAVCLDEARRLTLGETVTILEHPGPKTPGVEDVVIRYVDSSVVVTEKPSGMITLRHSSERSWSLQRRLLQPTLDEAVAIRIARHAAARSLRKGRVRTPRLYSIHRIDRDTSGLVLFARTEVAQEMLIKQFAERKAHRSYLALVPGKLADRTIRNHLVRDRGDGVRGSTPMADDGKEAITHIRTLRKIWGLSELECKLETGRTNQIRIHLAELGHPVCGDIKYRGPIDNPNIPDRSRCPRLALHAAELRFVHPESNAELSYDWSWPDDILRFLKRLERR